MADTKELRADADPDLVRALDALALAHDMHRTTYMIDVLEKHVRVELHKINMVTNALRGNPLLSDTGRSRK